MAVTGNLPNNTQNATTSYFNNFFTPTRGISAGMNDTVVAYFQSITGDVDTGKTLASAVIYTAAQQGIDPVDIVDQLKKLSTKNKQSSPQYSQQISPSGSNNETPDPHAKPGPSTTYNSISEIDAYLTMFLNLNRVGTSLLGLSNSPQTSKYISRAILP